MANGNDDISSPETWRATFAEFIATLLFVFIGAGTVVVTGGLLGDDLTSARLVAIALAHGLAITLLVSATFNISGGHINPAVTVSALITGQISLVKSIMYIIAQLVGAVVGAYLIAVVIPDAAQGNLGSHGLGKGITVVGGLITEIILTFVLLFVVFSTAMDPKGLGRLAPVAIGFVVLVNSLIGMPITGASMNPARSFGPALMSGSWDNHWIFWIGPIVGGPIAALVYKYVFMSDGEQSDAGGAT